LALLAGCFDRGPSIDDVRQMQESGHYRETIEPLRRLIAEDPENPEVLFLYGRALWSTGQFGLAMWPLKDAMEDPEYRRQAGNLFANSLMRSEAWEDAEKICNELLAELEDDQVEQEIELLTLRSYARQGSRSNYEGAIEDADRVLELDPDNTDVLIPRTVSLLALERVDEAAEALRQLDELYRDESLGLTGSAKFCTAGAVFAKEKGEPDLARERFNRCLEEFPADSLLLQNAIEFYDGRREFDRSLEILELAVEAEPESQDLRDGLALRLHAAGKEEEAVSVLLEATEQESIPAQIRGWVSAGGYYSSINEMDEAIAAYEHALELLSARPPDLDVRYADALVRAGRYEEALAWAEGMEVPAQRSMIRGRALLDMGEPAAALEAFSEGNRLWPNNAIARYYTAVAAERLGLIDRAVEEYRYSVRIEPDSTDAVIRLAKTYVALGEPSNALSVLGLATPSHPQAAEILALKGEIMSQVGIFNSAPRQLVSMFSQPTFRGQGMAALAQGTYERAGLKAAVGYLEAAKDVDWTDPREAEALAKLVDWLPELDRAGDAVELADKAREAHPEEADFWALYGQALLEQASSGAEPDPEPIRSAFQKALELEEDNPIALRGLAAMQASIGGHPEEAIELYQRAIELDPRDEVAPEALARLLRSLGRTREAVEVVEQWVREQPWNASGVLLLVEMRLDAGMTDREEAQRNRELLDRARRLRYASRRHLAWMERLEARSSAG
jgi:tetratricopeptide (TPR) repeat protein